MGRKVPSSVTVYSKNKQQKLRQLQEARKQRWNAVNVNESVVRTDVTSESVSSASSSEMKSATQKKFEMHEKLDECQENKGTSISYDDSTSNFRIVDISLLSQLVNSIPCTYCQRTQLFVTESEKHFGFASELQLKCGNCDLIVSACPTSRKIGDSAFSPYEVNRRVSTAAIDMGVGFAGISRFSSIMGMKCLHQKQFVKHSKSLSDAVDNVAVSSLETAAEIIRKVYSEQIPNNSDNDIIDLAVTYDGSWMRRGHTSNFGIGVVIELITGLVIDYEVMSKYCHGCTTLTEEFKKSDAYEEWKKEHCCDKNFDGSSGAMEMTAALIIWKRSIEKYKFHYTTLLCDGDAKTYIQLNEAKVYGDNCTITKEECINHVSKRMGTALRNLISESRNRGITLGGRGHGKLTQETIKKLTAYYQNAIRKNIGDVSAMRNAIYATLFHLLSTDSDPHHKFCPVGADSWCFYQRAASHGEEPPSHRNKIGTPLSREVAEQMLPIYKRLSDDELLKRCQRGKTQNANESLHSMIWSKCPKTSFLHKRRIETGVGLAVCQFNRGRMSIVAVLDNMGIEAGEVTIAAAKSSDSARIAASCKHASEKEKLLRKKRKFELAKADDSHKKKEGGPSYEPGKF